MKPRRKAAHGKSDSVLLWQTLMLTTCCLKCVTPRIYERACTCVYASAAGAIPCCDGVVSGFRRSPLCTIGHHLRTVNYCITGTGTCVRCPCMQSSKLCMAGLACSQSFFSGTRRLVIHCRRFAEYNMCLPACMTQRPGAKRQSAIKDDNVDTLQVHNPG